jgi:hypothetical protein
VEGRRRPDQNPDWLRDSLNFLSLVAWEYSREIGKVPNCWITRFIPKVTSTGSKGEYSSRERWTENANLGVRYVNGMPLFAASVRITLDYVLFDNGTGWGPNKSRQAVALGKIRQGVVHERDRLRKLLATRGVQALLDDLVWEVTPE